MLISIFLCYTSIISSENDDNNDIVYYRRYRALLMEILFICSGLYLQCYLRRTIHKNKWANYI